ncbi:hypothetical protein G6011_01476 [Alternaria panax]|uniref:3'-5' exonuclease domain-containing protein n=1 Tax=Alternaria panax TaxID=48097 RepID=A0AAD4IKW0_9PLEO|nr:hypothetical protein G6011_01476 [Alternaria panax]
MAGDHRRIRQASATLHVRPAETPPALSADRIQRVGLWNPAHGLRFATTATAKAPKPDSIPEATETAPSRIDQSVATTRTDDPSSSTQDEASDATEHTGEAAVERASVRCDASGVSSQSETESKDADEDDTDGYVSLTYQIPEEKLRAAMLATPNTRDSYWSAKLYQGPDGEPLSTHYCKSFDVAERVAKYFLQEKVVGFDIEWKPRGNPHAIKQNASLIQLACEDRIALFHVSLFSGNKVEQLMPPSLKAVLESPDIYKVGVAVKGDFTRLEKYLNIQPQGVFELSRLHNLVEWYEVERSKVSNRLVSLTSQVLQHLQLPLYKGEQLADDPKTTSSVRESDWTLPLDMHQIHYAAADAYAGFRLYHMLEWKRTRMKPTPPPVALCDFDNKPTPRSKELPHKRAKKSKDVADTVVKSAVDVAEERQEDEGDAEGYETATEELTDSHQLEEPPYAASESACTDEANQAYACQPTPHSDLEKTENLGAESRVAPKKRIGRVKLSRLNNTDPGYPKLPKISQEEDAGTLSPALSRDDVNMRLEDQDKNVSFQKQESDDDEYADPELEDALGHMTLDDSGSLTEDANNVASEHTNSPPVANHNEASYLNPTSLHLHESHEPITASQSDIGLLEEPSRKPEYNLATTWAHEHLRLTIPSPSSAIPSRIRATVTHLRAYHMWYHQKLPVEKMTHVLRDPPLSSNTVANYILQAVTLERLEYERDSLKDVLLALPSGMRQGRWRALANEVDALK